MIRTQNGRILTVLVAVVLASLPETASACAACMGDPNTKSAGAINAAIFLMLGFIGTMLAGLASFGVYLMKRANTLGAATMDTVAEPQDQDQEEK